MRILLIEDEEDIGSGVQISLTREGHTVDWLKDGGIVMQMIKDETFDLVILDLGLPNVDGFTLLRKLRSERYSMPILILSARDALDDRVEGLDRGADDYVTKPFDLDELLARIRALERRITSRSDPTIRYRNIELDPAAHIVTQEGLPISIPRREFTLLQKLLENQGRVLSRENLTQSLYGWVEDVDSNTLEVHIHNLRKKFIGNFIRTVRGVGYMAEKE